MNKAFSHIISLYITPLLSRLSIFLLLLAINASAQGTLTEGREKFYDRLTDTYLYSVPKECFDDGRVGEYLDAQTATTGRTDFTYLPIVHLKGDFGYEYTEGTVSVVMPDGTTSQTNLKAKLKWRGGTTNKEGKHKRNYSVKFLNASGDKQDYKFFGLRKDNHWILDAGQVDYSRIRNRVATDIWNDFATKPYYYDKEPKALTGTRGQFVEVFLNDEYRGIYCMTECIDRSQMKLKKYTDNADGTQTIHGQLWKATGTNNILSWMTNGKECDNTSDIWGNTEMKYPEIDDVSPTDWSIYYNAMEFVKSIQMGEIPDLEELGITLEEADASIETFRNEVASYFDIPVLMDYYLFTIVLNAIDNYTGKNMYWGCYDTTVDKKLTIAVWDLDCTTGGYFTTKLPRPQKYVGPKASPIATLKPLYALKRYDVDGFRQKFFDRYKELRSTYFSAESLKKRYNDYMNMLRDCNAYSREAKRWNGDSDLSGNSLDFDAEQELINNWIDERLAFLDNNIDKTIDIAYDEEQPVLELETATTWEPITDTPVNTQIYVTFEHARNTIYSPGNAKLKLYNDIKGAYLLTLPESFDITNGNASADTSWVIAPKGSIAEEGSESLDFIVFLDFENKGVYTIAPLHSIDGIEEVTVNDESSSVYNILGQRISLSSAKGKRQIIIINGKKVMHNS